MLLELEIHAICFLSREQICMELIMVRIMIMIEQYICIIIEVNMDARCLVW